MTLAALAEADPAGDAHRQFAALQQQLRAAGGEWQQLAAALDRLLAEPALTEDELCGDLHFVSATIVMAIQLGLRDPSALTYLFPTPAAAPA